MPYNVWVDDNYHYMDTSYRGWDSEFATAEEAFARCRKIVDEYLDAAAKMQDNHTATKLWESYVMFGEDPFIIVKDAEPVDFSAWDYARDRCEARCGGRIEERRPSRYDPEHENYDPLS